MDFLNSTNVERVFHEKNSGNLALNEIINYSRSSNIIFVYSIEAMIVAAHMSSSPSVFWVRTINYQGDNEAYFHLAKLVFNFELLSE